VRGVRLLKKVSADLGGRLLELTVPANTVVLSMGRPKRIDADLSPKEVLKTSNFDAVVANKVRGKPGASAVIVISDNTRPVPYKGQNGILWPLIEELMAYGVSPDRILILVATGTHRGVTARELRDMLDPRVFEQGIAIINHDCDDGKNLVYLGTTSRGSVIHVNRHYVNADIRILTGLVESHFMAGASGGRKSICPGIVSRQSTHVFHGAEMLASPNARDLVLEGNPCHEEALEVALMAGVDFIVNVTLDRDFALTGIFAGDLETAHQQAVERIKEYVAIPVEREYDIVVTHAGFVGINHYQVAKAGVVALPALKANGRLIIAAWTTDQDHVGSLHYRTMIQLLKLLGPERFTRVILSPDWEFVPEQWEAQMWARVLQRTPQDNVIFFSPTMPENDYKILPNHDGNLYLPCDQRYRGAWDDTARVVEAAVLEEVRRIQETEKREAAIAFLADGPYGIPVKV
jgi:hypothetical protein